MRAAAGENWILRKPAAVGRNGVVASQSRLAAEAGAEILAAGGNAVDAAVATALAVGVVEPWMSGIGGGGMMVIAPGDGGPVKVVDFAMMSPAGLDPADYPIDPQAPVGGLFGWPTVIENRNLVGYKAIGVPGAVEGLGFALEKFGTKRWSDVLAPAITLAERGLPVDWHTTLLIALEARHLKRFEASSAIYLRDGVPPVSTVNGVLEHLPLPALTRTLKRLAEKGPREFYEGELAGEIVADLKAGGSRIDAEDLKRFRARVVEPLSFEHQGTRIDALPGLTGGVTLRDALRALGPLPKSASAPDLQRFVAIADAFDAAFKDRLVRYGHAGDQALATNTTNLCAVDRDGTMVALTNTLVELFGARVVLPRTGITMNNSICWFDPRPGTPNALAPSTRPLINMCPIVASRGGRPWFALGACGGRKIIPAVGQIALNLIEHAMSLEDAVHHPRLDVVGAGVTADERLPAEIVAALGQRHKVRVAPSGVQPNEYATPSAVLRRPDGVFEGMAHPALPVAAAVAAP
jgi:gamma-glutamyltranspeptidase/glutathione hydrolase